MIRLVGLAAVAAEIERLRAELDALRDPQEFKVTLSKQQLPAALEEKQRQVNYWGDRCCKAEAQRDQLLAALDEIIGLQGRSFISGDGLLIRAIVIARKAIKSSAIAAAESSHD